MKCRFLRYHQSYSVSCLLLFVCGLLYGTNATAQVSVIPKSYVDSLNQLASSDSLYYFQAIKYAQKAFDAAQAIDYIPGEFKALQHLGLANLNLNQYDAALDNFFAAKKIGEAQDSLTYIAFATYYIGNVYNYLNNNEEALKNFQAAYDLYEELGNAAWRGVTLNGIAAVQDKNGEHNAALESFKKSVEIFEQNGLENMSNIPLGNIGECYFKKGKYDLSERYFKKSYELAKKSKDPKVIAGGLLRLGIINNKKKNFAQSESQMLEALTISEVSQYNSLIVEIKQTLSKFYTEQNEFKKSNEYLIEATTLNDSLVNVKLTSEIAKIQASYADEKRDRELAETREEVTQLEFEKKIALFTNLATVLALIGLGLISWLFYSRNKAKRALLQTRLQSDEKERDDLRQELKSKQQDLTNFALDISRKNDLSEELYTGLKSIANASDSDKAKAKARELLLLTSNHLKINDDIKKFQQNVDVVNQDFFNRLAEKFPSLTANEKQLCGLIRLNLSTKDIASVRNISPKSVEMGRYRLRKKLQLASSDDIANFIQSL